MLCSLRVCIDLTALAQALDSQQAHTSFGKLPLSVEKSSHMHSFPQSKKEDQHKVYISGLTQQENIGKNSSCFYQYDDKIKYAQVSATPTVFRVTQTDIWLCLRQS